MIDLRPHNDPKRLMEEAKDWAATCRRQKDEIERLRAALHKAEIEREYWRGCTALTKDQIGGFLKRLQDWINEGELRQGDAP